MMKNRYIMTALVMLCFSLAMPVSTLAVPAPIIASVTALEIEEIVKKDISKLTPQILQDVIAWKIPQLKASIVRDIIIYGLGGGIVGMTPKDIQALIHLSIPKLSPSIVEDILRGKIPGIDIGIIEEMIQTGLLGGIGGMTVETFKELLKKNILSLPKVIIDDLMNGKISGISIQEIVTAITGGNSSNSNSSSGTCVLVHFPYKWFCMPHPCDSVLKCVMKKQRKTLEARLDDLINTIKANTKQTEHQTKIIEQEVLAYRRLEARVKKEALSLKEARYLSKKIKDSVSIGSTIESSKKGQ